MENRKEIVKHGIIDEKFNEHLFRLWYCGKPLTDIVRMFQGTQKEFSLSSLRRTMEKFGWEKRRIAISKRIEEESNDTIVAFTKKRLEILNNTITILGDQMDDYLKDPENNRIPEWIPKTTKEVDTVFRLQEFMNNGGADKTQVDIKNSIGVELDIPDEAAAKILKLLAEGATKKLTDPDIIEAEIEEFIADSDIINE